MCNPVSLKQHMGGEHDQFPIPKPGALMCLLLFAYIIDEDLFIIVHSDQNLPP